MIGIHSLAFTFPSPIVTSFKAWEPIYRKETVREGIERKDEVQDGTMGFSEQHLYGALEFIKDDIERKHLIELLPEGLTGFEHKGKRPYLKFATNFQFKEMLREDRVYLGSDFEITFDLRKAMEKSLKKGHVYFPMKGFFKDDVPFQVTIEDALNNRERIIDTKGVYQVNKLHENKVYPTIMVVRTEFPELVAHQKYSFGVMTQAQYQLAFDQLDVELGNYGLEYGINWSGVRINRLHLYKDIEVSRPFQDYIPLFERLHMKYQRNTISMFGNQYVYKNKTREIAIYDKMRHLKDMKVFIPNVWKGKNVIRIEYRINNSQDFKDFKIGSDGIKGFLPMFEELFQDKVMDLLKLGKDGSQEADVPTGDFDGLMRKLIDRGESPIKAMRMFMAMNGTNGLIDADGGLHETMIHIKQFAKDENQYNYMKRFIGDMARLAIEMSYTKSSKVNLYDLLNEIREGVQTDLKTVPFQGTIGGMKGCEEQLGSEPVQDRTVDNVEIQEPSQENSVRDESMGVSSEAADKNSNIDKESVTHSRGE